MASGVRAGLRGVEHAHGGRRRRPSGSWCRRAVRRRRRQHARPDHRRQPELADPHPGHRRRPPADPHLADRSTARSSPRQDVTSAPKVAVLGSVVADNLFGPDVDPTGQIIRDQEPAVQGHRRDGQQGVRHRRRGSGRHGLWCPTRPCRRSCMGIQHINNITVSADVVRTTWPTPTDGHRRGAAHPPQDHARRPRRLHGPDAGRNGRRPDARPRETMTRCSPASRACRCSSAASGS